MIEDVTSEERNFDAVQLGWVSDLNLGGLRDLFHSENLGEDFQSASYANPEVDSLLDRATSTVDRAQARPMWRRVQQIMRDEQPWTFMFYYMDLFAARDWLHTTELDARGLLADVTEWWIDPGSRRRSAPARGDSVADTTQGDSAPGR